MTAMMAATAAVVTAALVVLGFLPVCVNAGMRLLTRSELFSPTSQSQQQNSRKSEYETLHTDLVESLSQSTRLTLRTGKSFTIGYVLA
jgi:hypothetical protein